jgi:hypothetical protein
VGSKACHPSYGTTNDINPKDTAFFGFKRAQVTAIPLLLFALR